MIKPIQPDLKIQAVRSALDGTSHKQAKNTSNTIQAQSIDELASFISVFQTRLKSKKSEDYTDSELQELCIESLLMQRLGADLVKNPEFEQICAKVKSTMLNDKSIQDLVRQLVERVRSGTI